MPRQKEEHTRYYNKNDIEVPSVTTIIKIFNKNLDGWANYMGLKGIRLDPYLEEKATLGTYVHAIGQKFFDENDEVDKHPDLNLISYNEYRELLRRYQAILDYMESMGYKPYVTEYAVTTENYGGTCDLLFYNQERNDYILVDIKTAKSTYNTMYMQLMAYANLLEVECNIHVSQVAILLILQDESKSNYFKLYSVNDPMCVHYKEIFFCLLKIYHLLTEAEKNQFK